MLSDAQRECAFSKKFEEDWKTFWKPILYKKGKLDVEAVKAEIHDFAFVLEQVGKVYSHVTGGLLSKPTYWADTVIAAADDATTKQCEDAVQEALADYENDHHEVAEPSIPHPRES